MSNNTNVSCKPNKFFNNLYLSALDDAMTNFNQTDTIKMELNGEGFWSRII